MHINPLKSALNSSKRFTFKEPESVVDHIVVGGGVVGLAVARYLAQRFPDKTTVLLERHTRAGEETSSRNSEVVHAGLYYPPGSLKTQLCLRGRQLMYEYCERNSVPYRKAGKLVVARADQLPYIESLHRKAQVLKVPPRWGFHEPLLPTKLIDGNEAREMEPSLSPQIAAALYSSETGIVDSHSLMESFERDIEDAGGSLVYATRVVRVDPSQSDAGWVVQAVTGDGSDSDAMLARVLINSSGLSGPLILNSLLPHDQQLPMYFARGSYASYKGPGIERISHLIYPCPAIATRKDSHSFQSLGTHLTLDLQGKVRFGPDLDWLAPPVSQEDEAVVDFWTQYLVPDATRVRAMHAAITSYLPHVTLDGLQPDYSGIRPKLVGPGGGFQDFVFRLDMSSDFTHKAGGRGSPMINLLGIESPGLTSSMAIAEAVVEDLLIAKGLDLGDED
ncbi:NAD dehydrogenase [Vararia minispora EC-137]|uniref:NAD dehydrogenase n=1 Tax=Vararia minispora EC-137 TaxID=1314806 RepID=A0ACB8QSE1_9AGAM|nr:NAD dehydrogenase [Vararia minispora EC-137]